MYYHGISKSGKILKKDFKLWDLIIKCIVYIFTFNVQFLCKAYDGDAYCDLNM
jgi:hypothetical protein